LKSVLVTSAIPAEGKSYVAANLAHSFVRESGRLVLLMDADLRRPQLHVALGAPASPGLSDYLREEADEVSIIQHGSRSNLFFAPAGTPSNINPAELINNGRLQALLGRMAEIFDWIILDSPPTLPVVDAGLLANLSDGVLLVVRASLTPCEAARKACSEFNKDKLVGVVLNHAEISAGHAAYY
jgi:capsular exopolysaccharide synthesis family protein